MHLEIYISQHSSQEHELALTRQYEQQILSRETATMERELSETAAISVALAKISQLLRQALRTSGGEDPVPRMEEDDLVQTAQTSGAWALERECELARLERENEELRALLHLRDDKDLDTLRAEVIRETRESYLRRAEGHHDSPFIAHGLDDRGSRMFSQGAYRGIGRGSKRGSSGIRGKPRMFAGSHSPAW